MSSRVIKRLLVLLPLLSLLALLAAPDRPSAWLPRPYPIAAAFYPPVTAANASLGQIAQETLPFLPYLQLAPQVNLRQTLEPFTVTAYRIYADANQVFIAYAVEDGWTTSPFPQQRLTLTDAGGTEFPLTMLIPYPARTVAGLPGAHITSFIAAFDTPFVTSLPAALDLRLTLDFFYPSDVHPSTAVLPRPFHYPSDVYPSTAVPPGPFHFAFTTPVQVAATRVIDLNQTTRVTAQIEDQWRHLGSAADVPMTLERMIVTPGAVRAILHYDLALLQPIQVYGYEVGTVPVVDLRIDQTAGYRYGQYGLIPDRHQLLATSQQGTNPYMISTYQWAYTIHSAFADQGGEGVLTVSTLYDDFMGDRLPAPTVTGPWTFHFTVPPLVQ